MVVRRAIPAIAFTLTRYPVDRNGSVRFRMTSLQRRHKKAGHYDLLAPKVWRNKS